MVNCLISSFRSIGTYSKVCNTCAIWSLVFCCHKCCEDQLSLLVENEVMSHRHFCNKVSVQNRFTFFTPSQYVWRIKEEDVTSMPLPDPIIQLGMFFHSRIYVQLGNFSNDNVCFIILILLKVHFFNRRSHKRLELITWSFNSQL